ncbi:hypothetical protein [Comamonas thiooxydans]|uniref:hypothetical protein n=1 Tax=Comamonas thiooxydans TaxID=363952 RepID=UPI00050DD376|nr:hypothetical protein [Comamonas thiooxydans]KGH29222.1 hypothetical protein P606_02830 [Comamonas thiooxydans]
MRAFQIAAAALGISVLAACAAVPSVRQADLDSWKGMPVEALDTHSLFATMRMTTRTTSSGVEVRNYANEHKGTYCSGSAFNASCVDSSVACNNLFYIKNGMVVEYAPTGQCMTNDTVRPERRYLSLTKQ